MHKKVRPDHETGRSISNKERRIALLSYTLESFFFSFSTAAARPSR
jgi:hypothetical protein